MTRRILVVDDQELVRSGLRLIIEALGYEVVGESADGREGVDQARRLRPDVCLMDIRMPRMDGLEATRLLAGPAVPDPIPVVVLTTFDLDEYVRAAIANGASGFLLKDAGPGLIAEAIEAAANGEALIAPSITVRFLEHFADARSAGVDVPLSERELEVARQVAKGRTNSEIGAELHMALGTVKTHLTSIQQKLAVRNRVEIAAWVWSSGLVD